METLPAASVERDILSHAQILLHGQSREDATPLWNIANSVASPSGGRHTGDLLPLEDDGTRRHSGKTDHGPHERRLARAVPADESHDLPVRNIDTDFTENRRSPVP